MARRSALFGSSHIAPPSSPRTRTTCVLVGGARRPAASSAAMSWSALSLAVLWSSCAERNGEQAR